jgi:hypothetical protein
VHELASGLWHWQAPHPDWSESEPWDQNVSSYAIDDGERPMEKVVEGLRPLLELPVEHVLATHGGPNDRAALERVLSGSQN